MMDKLKSVPLPIWIGLGLVLIVILLMNRNAGSQQQGGVAGGTVSAPAGPVTNATVGTQGAESGAGTDQQLGNLSVITQGGFAQIAQQNDAIARQIASGMSGAGTPMQQAGASMQSTQNGSAQNNALNGTTGQNAGSNPGTVPTG